MGALEKYNIDDNPFKVIYVDLTYRCNMSCNFCYNSEIHIPDITLEYFEEVCKRLPFKVIFRFLGGEPTIHPEFFGLLNIARKYGHLVAVVSNGKKYLDVDFVKELKKVRGAWFSMTMNGGLTNHEAYKMIDNEDSLEWKLEALNNLIEMGLKHISLTAIIMKGVNEDVIKELISTAENNKKQIKFLKFRSASNIGKHIKTIPYDNNEFINNLKPKYFDIDACNTIYTSSNKKEIDICEEKKCCHYFVYKNFLNVSFIEFGSEKSQQCWKRGFIDRDFNLYKLFHHVTESQINQEKDY